MWERIAVILRKEFIQALREPRMRVLLFVPPMVQLIVFGFAVNLDVDHARIAWMDMDRTPAEPRTARRGSRGRAGSTWWRRRRAKRTCSGRSTAARRRRWCACCRGFERDVLRGRTDGSAGAGGRDEFEHGVAGVELRGVDHRGVLGDVIGASSRTCRLLARSPARSGEPAAPQVTARTRVWFNPDLYSRNYFVPGRGREHHHDGDADADRDGDRAREGDRHDGAVDGDADAARSS